MKRYNSNLVQYFPYLQQNLIQPCTMKTVGSVTAMTGTDGLLDTASSSCLCAWRCEVRINVHDLFLQVALKQLSLVYQVQLASILCKEKLPLSNDQLTDLITQLCKLWANVCLYKSVYDHQSGLNLSHHCVTYPLPPGISSCVWIKANYI